MKISQYFMCTKNKFGKSLVWCRCFGRYGLGGGVRCKSPNESVQK